MKYFLNVVDDMQVYPINSIGGTFTWTIRAGLMSKIDHIFGNDKRKDK